ncbi:phage integrase SAM-like domain-containing protein [Arenibacter palladensis]|uniref:phage integrase SAM-like domain-containing protein n=1 Tax=Arenibacter algicola TaxID=616991 RepID=UPI001153B0A0
MDKINVTLLKNIKIAHESKGYSSNGIRSCMRAIRSIYNSAIKEDQSVPIKNPFGHFRTPSQARTKKKPVAKIKIMDL